MRITLTLLILLYVTSVQSQDWYKFQLDSTIGYQLPIEKVYELDTVIQDLDFYQIEALHNNSVFSAQKAIAEDSSVDENLSTLPYDSLSLVDYYNGVSNGLLSNSGCSSKEDISIIKDGYIGRRVILRSNEDICMVSEMYLLENVLYQFIFKNVDSKNVIEGQRFIDSIRINPNLEFNQFRGKPATARRAHIFSKILSYGIIFLFVYFIVRAIRRRNSNNKMLR